MEFQYDPKLLAYMRKQNKHTIVVEMVEINNSDFEISELHVRLVDVRLREYFLAKKNYRLYTTEHGEVLFPRFPLELAETVCFGLKSFLFFKYITYTGIKV
ncbi:MAG: hypothetical protein E7440_06920 [Ruminococcaceae bacterium]|nr:hypothetical protein [Oscillospiraceae bacterium]